MRYLLVILTFCTLSAGAQNETDAVKATVNRLFDGMRKGDSALLMQAFAPGAILQSVGRTREGATVVRTDSVAAFARQIGTPHTEVYDERIEFGAIHIDGNMASVWTPYKFYLGDKFSHCGVNSFQLVKLNGAWKIQYLIDTRRREGCEKEKSEVRGRKSEEGQGRR